MHIQDVGGIDDDVRLAPQPGIGERGMDGTRGQDRADRQATLVREPSVGEDDQLDAVDRRGPRLSREPADRRLQPGRSKGRIPGRVERPDASASAVADASPAAHEHLLE